MTIPIHTVQSGVIKYIQQVKGIGPSTASKIFDIYGPKLIPDILANKQQSLPKNIKVDHINNIRNHLLKQDMSHIKISVLCLGSGLGTKLCEKLIQHFGDQAYTTIVNNPYSITKIPRVGFLMADKLAISCGLEEKSPQRLSEAMKFSLYQSAKEDGRSALTHEEMIEYVKKITKIDNLMVEDLPNADGISCRDGIYLLGFFENVEQNIFSRIMNVVKKNRDQINCKDENISNALNDLAKENNIEKPELTSDQVTAIQRIFGNKLSIITGGPGTGKSFIIKIICHVASQLNLRVQVLAPTGRAAENIKQGCSWVSASTIHRKLGATMSGGFRRNSYNPIEYDLVIIDETSMLGSKLAHAVIDAIEPGTHVCFVGDADQIPSVDAGNFFHSILQCNAIPITRLTKIFRQQHGSDIIKACHVLNDFNKLWVPEEGTDFRFVATEKDNFYRTFSSEYQDAISQSDDVQVILPLKEYKYGVKVANQICQKIANKNGQYAIRNIRVGDRVMQMRNNYEKDVYNGDIGIVKQKTYDRIVGNVIEVVFGNKNVLYTTREIDELDLAYAQTVHKMQGGGFDYVIFCIFMPHFVLLNKNIIYTAMSRAKNKLVIVGQKKAIYFSLSKQTTSTRTSLLQKLIEMENQRDVTGSR